MQINSSMSILQNSYLQNSYLYQNQNVADSKTSFSDSTKDSKVQNSEEIDSKNTENTESTSEKTAPNGEPLEPKDEQYIRELESIDRNVRAHEAAHIAAGAGVVTGGASFSYTRGPDGKMYATAGEVPIAMKEGRTPEETIQNARQIVAAAMAPSDPSPQDYKVAASAAQMESSARSEQASEKAKEVEEALKKQEESQDNFKEQDKESVSQETDFRDFEEQNQKQDPFLRNYAVQSYQDNAKDSTEIFAIAG
ncbi:hypothetical protein LS70_000710 [Helicobacter sp. MIT 11-5569]|uniref:putative metalloprotease CJM1_0395 family protein n=1 Tax=Helicobacter sp. MIT 11-5569 TaxID=1548151 RepID=UPI00051F919E|nr:putative metalloprotease CJM1_0395 family protein [Helicobacter sp. MIT 11-5569]TLD85107.1 hypothetical protein LS70_000710 [Helicobacter sp. MIT 11-5569]